MADRSMPFVEKTPNVLTEGFVSFATETNSRHPVDAFQRSRQSVEWETKLDSARRIYGIGFAMMLESRRQMCEEPLRIPGLRSSRIALETAIGTDDTIDFVDLLGDGLTKSTPSRFRLPHDAMEVKLGMI